ncbi:MAG: hypothetical protein V1648_05020 [Candidatus Aenigmatarchaeota archaeon]
MKRDRVLTWSFILFTVTAAALLAAALMPADSMAASTTTIAKDWTCANGGFNNCFKTGCMLEKQQSMGGKSYTLAFEAPKTGDYKCAIKAVANQFDFPEGKAEINEVTDVSLNGVKVGSTTDSWCPPGGTVTPPELPNPCEEAYKKDMYACNKDALGIGCSWIYDMPGCGTLATCQGVAAEWHCHMRVCNWVSTATPRCNVLKYEGTAWDNPKLCSQYNGNAATCNDYNKHKGLVCCYDAGSGKCYDDPCMIWYHTRVLKMYDPWVAGGMTAQQAEDELEAHCEGGSVQQNPTYYVMKPSGLCQWDSGWDKATAKFAFPCRCSTNFAGTGRNIYLDRSGSPSCKATGQTCTINTECCSNICTGGKCQSDGSICKVVGQTCSGNSECCSDICTNGICQSTPCEIPCGIRCCSDGQECINDKCVWQD